MFLLNGEATRFWAAILLFLFSMYMLVGEMSERCGHMMDFAFYFYA